ncbi:MAG: membrane protein insertion efficiency factor YidD [Candidatus Margulisiibacteriota bacterium]|nr:MAG: membrane protein insertion efficiency factor YidD [Candidatus Margulisbacteria bacterium GWF2_38_17]OGI08550.1 MAG: membrane protein insertion efficiency factor YidD [Candidatus Margulisbacteria bacterium GWE2_39_32]PZM78202.1 MAG: membrane protein insertion efficiency factor YidD [Candidatus Margulisiibacteriota bacterium]HAR63463.1 membrane protein insertion efficiency factor YidD [Candidatus Margulisiibacteriota bacterium]HCT85621.1 membrane protein insertion efficiency factor YidD [
MNVNYLTKVIIKLISSYQLISSYWPARCRFYPTCSQYAKDSFFKYGLLKGFNLTIKRLSKCHPFHPGGIDPVM